MATTRLVGKASDTETSESKSDVDLLGRQKKHFVVRPLELLAAICRCGPANRFDGFDLEGPR